MTPSTRRPSCRPAPPPISGVNPPAKRDGRGWVIVFTGAIDAAESVEAELRAAGIETRSMANTNRLAGYGEIFSLADVAVPRRNALEASHVLRLDAVDPEAALLPVGFVALTEKV